MDWDRLLSVRLIAPLSSHLGDVLVAATYRCIEQEISTEAELEDPCLYIGGELHLSFNRGPLILTWDEHAGWPDHFSLYAGKEPLFLPGAQLESWTASNLHPWKSCIGGELNHATVLGRGVTPHAVALQFGATVVAVGDGYETRFGDGDDLLIRDDEGLQELKTWDVLWESR